jgi:hypothetical protein
MNPQATPPATPRPVIDVAPRPAPPAQAVPPQAAQAPAMAQAPAQAEPASNPALSAAAQSLAKHDDADHKPKAAATKPAEPTQKGVTGLIVATIIVMLILSSLTVYAYSKSVQSAVHKSTGFSGAVLCCSSSDTSGCNGACQ